MAGISRIIAIAVCSAPVVFGCSGSRAGWVGEWIGTDEALGVRDVDDDIARTLKQVRLTLREDGTFELTKAGIPYTGRVVYGKDRSFLKVDKIFDRRVESLGPATVQANQDMRLDKMSDGTLILTDPSAFEPKPISLRPVAKP